MQKTNLFQNIKQHLIILLFPHGFPTLLNIPEDNPMTEEGIALGRFLFYDTRLAGRAAENKYMSCSSCHIQENGFINGMPRPYPFGLDGDSTHHAMLPMINLVWNPRISLAGMRC
ncbi:MAG: cytochrome c peroxidase [Bacteroidales bacterium]